MTTAQAVPNVARRQLAASYARRVIAGYERDLAATDRTTECGIAHSAVLESVIADWRKRLGEQQPLHEAAATK